MYDFTKAYLLTTDEEHEILNLIDPNIQKNKEKLTLHTLSWQLFFKGNKKQLKSKKEHDLSLFIDLEKQRFGNTYISLLNMLAIMKEYNIKRVYLQQKNNYLMLKNVFDLEKLDIIPTEKFLVRADDELILNLNVIDCYRYQSKKNPALLKPYFSVNEANYDLNTIVIHIRSGDIFYPGNVYPNYGQPPLVWYQFCIQEHIKNYGNSSILLVYENNANPVIDALKEWCKEQSIEVYCTLSSSLLYDYRILFSAKVLVDSCGTFLRIVKHLSKNLELCYEYQDTYLINYIKRGKWENTNTQRELMLTLDEKNLNTADFQPTPYNIDSSFDISQEMPSFALLFEKALKLYENTKFEEAKEAFLECALYYPLMHDYREYLSKCFREEENYEMLERNASMALQLEHPPIWPKEDLETLKKHYESMNTSKSLNNLKLQNKLLQIMNTHSFSNALYTLLAENATSFKKICFLPYTLLIAWKKIFSPYQPKEVGAKGYIALKNFYIRQGLEETKSLLLALHRNNKISRRSLAYAYSELAREERKYWNMPSAIETQWLAFETNPSYYHLKWLAFHYCDAQDYATAKTILELLPEDNPCSEFEKKKIMGIMNFVKL